MVLCIVAFVVLGILGIFSAKYRVWAKESFACVARMLTFRPCETRFDEKIKASAVAALMKRKRHGMARIVQRHFKALSWAFTIAFILSLVYSGYTVYNLAVFGSCDPVHPEDCVFNPGGDPNKVICPYQNLNPTDSIGTIGGFRNIETAEIDGKPTVYFFGTTTCPHCTWERPVFNGVTAKFSGLIEVKEIKIDISRPPADMAVFSHYSPEGKIPLIVIGGKYFRIGSGEAIGAESETATLTALLCKATGSTTAECSTPGIAALVQTIR